MEFVKRYPNGLRLVAKRMEGFYTVSFGIFVNVGSVCENDKENGFSHFVEHLLFKGTPTRTALQISEEMDDIGASMNAFTSKEMTCFYTKSVAEDLEKCIEVLSDMYLNASFPEGEMDKERGVVLEEINMSADTPEDVSYDLLSQGLYFNQPLGKTILGNPENIKYCDRHSISEYKSKHYYPANTVISVVGMFDFDQLDKWIVKYFGAEVPSTAVAHVLPANQPTAKFFHKFKDINQCHLELGWGGCSYNDDDIYALSLMCNILGGGMTSRLFQTIREKHGLVYTVSCYPSGYTNSGMVEIYAGLGPDNCQKYCDLVRDEIVRFVDGGVTQKELVRAQTQTVNGLLMTLENTLTLMRLYGRKMTNDQLYDIDRTRQAYLDVTVDDVNAIARKVFATPFASSYVGPQNDNYDCISKIKI